MRDEEITGVGYMAATVLRVTPLKQDGTPDHPWAMTYHLDEPLLFGVGTVECVPAFTRSPMGDICLADVVRPRMVGALVAEFEHPQCRDIGAIAQGLWQARRTGTAVEAWSESGPGTWWYALAPWWRHQWDRDLWPLKEMQHRAYAVGDFLAGHGYTWPAPSPLPEPYALGLGTQLILAETTIAPPAPGFQPSPGAAT
ncbi:hypothetical protein [Streptomyces sp. NPDC006334]|uniref:hypothetical protein n=1 Tax=Streptomyces sp. NPDC006334 TaxID=3156754 RepID=UPI0033BC0AA5